MKILTYVNNGNISMYTSNVQWVETLVCVSHVCIDVICTFLLVTCVYDSKYELTYLFLMSKVCENGLYAVGNITGNNADNQIAFRDHIDVIVRALGQHIDNAKVGSSSVCVYLCQWGIVCLYKTSLWQQIICICYMGSSISMQYL